MKVLVILVSFLVLGCSSNSPSTDAPTEDSRLIGKWHLSSAATLANGHEQTAENDYEFRSDGTFTNISHSKLLNGDTGDPFFTMKTVEAGTWTLQGDTTCWTTPTATLDEFETFTELVTREAIEEGLAEDTPPECFTIESADDSTVVLKPSSGGDPVTLLRRK